MDSSNLRSFCKIPEKLKNYPTYPSASGCAGPKMSQTCPGARLTCFCRVRKFSTTFSAKQVIRTGKNGSAIFYSRPRLKFELTRENGRNTSNTGSKSYVWQLVRRLYGIASETEMLSVGAVWVMPSLTACHILSTPIRKAKPNISDGGTSPYTFAASFNGEKLEEKTMESAKKVFNFFQN